MSAPSRNPKPRLWILESSLYPARIQIYLSEKGIVDNFDLIPISVSHAGAAPTPGKPPGSVPILEIQRSTTEDPDKLDGKYVFQSTAILEYLEDVYSEFGPDMRGKTPEERARVRDCMTILNEAVIFMEAYWHNASPLFAGKESQSDDTARWAVAKSHTTLSKLEKIADPLGPFLARAGGQPTIVDCVLLAAVDFGRDLYGDGIVDGHERLKVAVQAWEGRESRGSGVVGGIGEEVKTLARDLRVKRGGV